MTRGRRGYWKVMVLTLVLGVSLWLGMAMMAVADTSDSYDVERRKDYENCAVMEQVDMLTDEVSVILTCQEQTFTDMTGIAIWWNELTEELRLGVSKGVMFHLDDRIPVAVRIDKGKVIRGNWFWSSGSHWAVTLDRQLIMALIDELAKGKRLVVQVGEERGNVVLDGSAAAVKDFRQRLKRQ